MRENRPSGFWPLRVGYWINGAQRRASRRNLNGSVPFQIPVRFEAPVFFLCVLVLSVLAILSGNVTFGDRVNVPSLNYSPFASSPGIYTLRSDSVKTVTSWLEHGYYKLGLRIYVYDLPPEFNQELVEDSIFEPPQLLDPWCNINFYSADDALTQFLKQNKAVRTFDPLQADYFWVPVYSTCYLITHLPNNIENTGAFFQKALRHITVKYPFWNNSFGSDHLFAFTQGFGARLAGNWRLISNATFLVHNGDYSESHFRRGHDIVIPPNLAYYVKVPVPTVSKEEELDAKNIFAFFGGQIVGESVSDHRGSNHSHGIRQYMKRHLDKLPGYHISDAVRDDEYVELMLDSLFCLCPEGWHKWSPRPYYAILLDCIPVVISSQQELALSSLIDYSKFVVYVNPSEIRNLNSILRAISQEEILKRRMEMRRIWRLVHYGPNGLASESVLFELWLRKQNRK